MNKVTALNSCTVSNAKCLCFDDLTPEEAELITENSMEVTFKKGETICKHGTIAPHIMYLKEGLAKVYLEGLNDSLILKLLNNNYIKFELQLPMNTFLQLVFCHYSLI